MNFAQRRDGIADSVRHVQAVLSYLCHTLCVEALDLDEEGTYGLYIIVSACGNTLQEVERKLDALDQRINEIPRQQYQSGR